MLKSSMDYIDHFFRLQMLLKTTDDFVFYLVSCFVKKLRSSKILPGVEGATLNGLSYRLSLIPYYNSFCEILF
jgi:hypothetical protein